MHRALRPALAAALAGALLLSACGSDDDSSSAKTPVDGSATAGTIAESADQDYCEAAIETADASAAERGPLFDKQLETAPEELKADFEILKENKQTLLDDPNALPPDASAALLDVLGYQSAQCGIDVGILG